MIRKFFSPTMPPLFQSSATQTSEDRTQEHHEIALVSKQKPLNDDDVLDGSSMQLMYKVNH